MNTTLFYFLYSFSGQLPWVDDIIIFLVQHADRVVLGLAVLFFGILFITHPHWKHKQFVEWVFECFAVGVSVVTAYLVSVVIKSIVQAPRPFIDSTDIIPLVIHGGYDSFPSGHATIFFALAMVIYLYHKPAGIFFFIAALVIVIARIIAGIHFPGDILAGAVIGMGIAYGVHRLITQTCQGYLLRKNGVK